MWNSRNLQYKDSEQGTQEQGSPNGTQNTSPRARLEWNVLWRKCHPGTHERLSIVDPQSGGQPLYSSDRKQVLAVNGEIYNHRDIRAQYAGRYEFRTGSDCEVILALYRDKGIHFLEELNGIFAFALYDEEKDEYLIARDPIGVIPLYIGKDAEGHVYFGSELKALEGFCDEYEPFLPGHYYHSKEGTMKRWYTRDWMEYKEENDKQADSRSPPGRFRTPLRMPYTVN